MTYENVFDLTECPKRLLVIGGGPVGCELAQAFARLGSRVTLVQDDPMFLGHEERDAAQLLSEALARDGIEIHLDTQTTRVHVEGNDTVVDLVNDEVSRMFQDRDFQASTYRIYTTLDLNLQRAAGDKEGEASTLQSIGGVYDRLGERQKALAFYNQALPLQRAAGDKEGEASTLHNIGAVYDRLGERQKALAFYSQALPLMRATGDKIPIATALGEMPKPVVAAPFARTLGGGAEIVLHSTRAQASAELYMGLVEVGVGLIPGGGGCKELLMRLHDPRRVFELIGYAKVSSSGEEAKKFGLLHRLET